MDLFRVSVNIKVMDVKTNLDIIYVWITYILIYDISTGYRIMLEAFLYFDSIVGEMSN